MLHEKVLVADDTLVATGSNQTIATEVVAADKVVTATDRRGSC